VKKHDQTIVLLLVGAIDIIMAILRVVNPNIKIMKLKNGFGGVSNASLNVHSQNQKVKKS
jgi:hypothetical protein